MANDIQNENVTSKGPEKKKVQIKINKQALEIYAEDCFNVILSPSLSINSHLKCCSVIHAAPVVPLYSSPKANIRHLNWIRDAFTSKQYGANLESASVSRIDCTLLILLVKSSLCALVGFQHDNYCMVRMYV